MSFQEQRPRFKKVRSIMAIITPILSYCNGLLLHCFTKMQGKCFKKTIFCHFAINARVQNKQEKKLVIFHVISTNHVKESKYILDMKPLIIIVLV